jgi:hypothetical protein
MGPKFKGKQYRFEPPDVIFSVSTLYKDFRELKGCLLKGMERNRLSLENGGLEKELYIHGTGDVVYLSELQERPIQKIQFGKRNPFELFFGKRIVFIDQYSFSEYKGAHLPVHVFIGIDSDQIPFEVMLSNNDGEVMAYACPSLRNMGRIAARIMSAPPGEWSEEDITAMALMKDAWSMQTLNGINVFAPLTERRFEERYPEVYKKIKNSK